MAMNTVAGDEVVFCIEGPDEEEAMKASGICPGRITARTSNSDLSLRPGLDKVIMNNVNQSFPMGIMP
ncbi:MAG: HPr family phosphocarrier protein [Enterocloster sp.]